MSPIIMFQRGYVRSKSLPSISLNNFIYYR
nr:MAG TPA: hypothetical protein [Caudoviricetes sp.]